jgi:glycosidase
MNYWVREVVLGLARGELSGLGAGEHLGRMAAAYRRAALVRSWNILASHDTARLASALPDPGPRRLARALSFVVPGVPHLYYGDEIGLRGAGDPENRAPMPWDPATWDQVALADVKALAALRRAHPALREGDHTPAPQPDVPEALAFIRHTARPEETIVVVANASDRPLRARLFLPASHLLDAMPLVDLRGESPPVTMAAGTTRVDLAPWAVALYTPDDTTIDGYRFLGRR